MDHTTNNPKAVENFKITLEKMRPLYFRLLEVKKKILVINFSVLVLSIILLLCFIHPYYEVTIKVVPDFGNKSGFPSSFSDVASIAGLSLQSSPATEIYKTLIFSESVLGPVILSKYTPSNSTDSIDLIQYFNITDNSNNPPEIRRRGKFLRAYRWLVEGTITTEVDRVTKILSITVHAGDGKMAADIANKVVSSLDEYVRTKRKTQASRQIFYIEKRLLQVKDSLTITENRLKDFSVRNRVIEQSPEYRLEQARLLREVEIQRVVYMELTKQLELAKIDAIRDMPIVNAMEWLEDPIYSPGPSKKLYLVLIMFFSLSISLGYYASKPELIAFLSAIKTSMRKPS